MRRVPLFSFLLLALGVVRAQEAVSSASGTGQAGNIILDWTFGEMALVQTVQSSNLMLTQGIHQGRLIAFYVSGQIADGELVLSPNPASALLRVQTGFFEPGQLSLALYDAQGKLLYQSNEAVTAFGTKSVNVTLYAEGMYVLHALFTPTSGKSRKRTYKIIKTR